MNTLRIVSSLALLSWAAGCGDDSPPSGPYEFVSADGTEGERSGAPGAGADAGAAAPDDGGGDDRTVEEGDIYRMLDEDTLLNLNSFRGLQVIDLSDLSRPRVVASLRVTGTPVELYVVGSRAVVLMSSWRGYYGSRDDVRVEGVEGGLVMTVDLTDRDRPAAIDRAPVPGWIRTSRLAREGDRASLYVAATAYGEVEGVWEARTKVTSLDVTGPKLVPRSELDLGGYVADVQATPAALLVARNDGTGGSGSTVSLVDISDPDGFMVEGGEVTVRGQVSDQFNMDLRGDVLRVVSGSTWGGTSTNHLETFDVSALGSPAPVDHCTFGDGEQLFATLFLEDRAFFVTYLRVDPFHAFALDAEGHCEERSEFVVSGWNDYFRSVLSDTRLVGIGVNDEESRTMAVSLYDITDLSNPTPLVARAEVEADSSWSEASWDHRAFTVLEGAVDATAPDGTPETGLVLLPFHGWDDGEATYQAAVQVYTFSESTLTRRGLMEHGTPVRRSFVAQPDVAANLSEAELSLYDTSDPDAPAELGRTELAPSYTRVLSYGDHLVRLKDTARYYWWWGSRASAPSSFAEVVSAADDPDRADPVATIAIPAGSRLLRAGSLLVVVSSVPTDTTSWPYEYETTIRVHDLSTPSSPVETGMLVTDRVRPDGYGPWGDCWDCGWYYGAPSAVVVGDAVVFPRSEEHSELLGTERTCHVVSVERDECADEATCTYYAGSIRCRSLDGAPEVCTGEIARCTWERDGGESCEPVDVSTIDTRRDCYDGERYRYWQSYVLDVLDLRDAARPRLADPLAMPAEDEATALLPGDDTRAFYTYKRPVAVPGDARPFVAWFFRALDLSDPSRPVTGAPVNVPGQLLDVSERTLITRDLRWGDSVAETVVHRLEWREDAAYLEASRRFADRSVESVQLDGAGHVLVTHGPLYRGPYYGGGVVDGPATSADSDLVRLSILSATDLSEAAAADVDRWASLRGAASGRALFQVPGGLLLMSLADPSHPRMQAYFPTMGWPSEILFEGDDIVFAAGPYGIYRFDADEENLLERE